MFLLLTIFLLFSFPNNSFLFYVMAVFPSHFLPVSLWCFLSNFMPRSHSPLPLLLLDISHGLPSYFILTSALIRPSIFLVLPFSLAHLSTTSPSSHALAPPLFFRCLSTAYPPVPFFLLTFFHTLPLLFSLFYFHAALSQSAVYRNHINPVTERLRET